MPGALALAPSPGGGGTWGLAPGRPTPGSGAAPGALPQASSRAVACTGGLCSWPPRRGPRPFRTRVIGPRGSPPDARPPGRGLEARHGTVLGFWGCG